MDNDVAILIPARWGSSRLEGKPLIELDGIPMIKKVFDECKKTRFDVFVLTDDERIRACVGKENSFIDNENYDNGTERCCGAAQKFKLEYSKIINVQGDMPDVTVDMIAAAVDMLGDYPVSTVYTDMSYEQQQDPNSVKLIRSSDQALWFGRGMTGYGDWHLGIYGYNHTTLSLYRTLAVTTEETKEKLEQLRWLKHGFSIGCKHVKFNGIEINTLEDVTRWHQKNYHS